MSNWKNTLKSKTVLGIIGAAVTFLLGRRGIVDPEVAEQVTTGLVALAGIFLRKAVEDSKPIKTENVNGTQTDMSGS
jgi:hypothetical protein